MQSDYFLHISMMSTDSLPTKLNKTLFLFLRVATTRLNLFNAYLPSLPTLPDREPTDWQLYGPPLLNQVLLCYSARGSHPQLIYQMSCLTEL